MFSASVNELAASSNSSLTILSPVDWNPAKRVWVSARAGAAVAAKIKKERPCMVLQKERNLESTQQSSTRHGGKKERKTCEVFFGDDENWVRSECCDGTSDHICIHLERPEQRKPPVFQNCIVRADSPDVQVPTGPYHRLGAYA